MKVRLRGKNNKKLEVNAVIDMCSDQSYARSDVIDYLELEGPLTPIEVTGIEGMSKGKEVGRLVETSLYSRDYSQEIKVNLAELPLICQPIKKPKVDSRVLNHRNLRNLVLADDYQSDEEKEIQGHQRMPRIVTAWDQLFSWPSLMGQKRVG